MRNIWEWDSGRVRMNGREIQESRSRVMRKRADGCKEGTGCRYFSRNDIALRFLCMRGIFKVEVVLSIADYGWK